MPMTRDEMISKLHTISACVANITYTYDIGLVFDLLCSRGVCSETGCNIGQWPCFKLIISEETKQIVSRVKKGENVTDEELLENKVIKELCTFHSYSDSWLVEGESLARCISQIRDGLKSVCGIQDSYYAYVTLEDWNVCVAFFTTYSEMKNYFYKKWFDEDNCIAWKDMSDDEPEAWYNVAEENDWDSVPYMEINDE